MYVQVLSRSRGVLGMAGLGFKVRGLKFRGVLRFRAQGLGLLGLLGFLVFLGV